MYFGEHPIAYNPVTEPSPWGGVTDPRRHNPDGFRYVVHGIMPTHRQHMPMTHAQSLLNGLYDEETGVGDQSISLFDEPERVNERISVSTSLIDQDHRATFGHTGIILELPSDNIVDADSQDLGALNSSARTILDRARQKGYLPSPEQILSATSPYDYNEVDALAATGPGRIAVAGVFIKTTVGGEPLDEHAAATMRSHARRLHVPVVSIPEPVEPFRQGIETFGEAETLAVNIGNRRYILDAGRPGGFVVMDMNRRSSFVSPGEIETVFGYMEAKGFNQSQLSALRRDYETADSERSRAQITFNPDGSVQSLKKVDGYGPDELEYTVYSDGTARSLSAPNRQKLYSRILHDSGSKFSYSDDQYYDAMSVDEVRRLAADACADLEPDRKQAVDAWLKQTSQGIESKHAAAQSSKKFGKMFSGSLDESFGTKFQGTSRFDMSGSNVILDLTNFFS